MRHERANISFYDEELKNCNEFNYPCYATNENKYKSFLEPNTLLLNNGMMENVINIKEESQNGNKLKKIQSEFNVTPKYKSINDSKNYLHYSKDKPRDLNVKNSNRHKDQYLLRLIQEHAPQKLIKREVPILEDECSVLNVITVGDFRNSLADNFKRFKKNIIAKRSLITKQSRSYSALPKTKEEILLQRKLSMKSKIKHKNYFGNRKSSFNKLNIKKNNSDNKKTKITQKNFKLHKNNKSFI